MEAIVIWDSKNKRHIEDWEHTRRMACGKSVAGHGWRVTKIEAAREIFAKGDGEFYCQRCRKVLFNDEQLACRMLAYRLNEATRHENEER
jgi:hypothetical protein